MAKVNFRQQKRQREDARKQRQNERMLRRGERPVTDAATTPGWCADSCCATKRSDVSRPARFTLPTNSRERLRYEQRQAPPLAQLYPQLAEVRVEFDFDDGTETPPSLQTYSHFPAARSLFRYPCPCHSCDGEFDLTNYVADMAGKTKRTPRTQRFTIVCPGQRLEAKQQKSACPIRATINISATAQTGDVR